MTDSFTEAMSKVLHPRARDLIRKHVIDFATELVIESKLVSFRKDAEEVLSSDVENAFENLIRVPPQSWTAQFMMIVGSAFFGAFVPGFVNELSKAPPNAGAIGSYVFLGFIGMLFVFMGLRKQ